MSKKTVSARIPNPVIPIKPQELKAFALKVEFDVERIQKMIGSIIKYNSACSRAADQLAKELKNNKLRNVVPKRPTRKK